MRNKEYKAKPIRMDDDTWEELKELRSKSGMSWNLFIKLLIQLYKDYGI